MGNAAANFDYTKCPPVSSDLDIDPTKQYPEEYNEFMTINCHWDYYGNQGWAYDDPNSLLTEEEVTKIIHRRREVAFEQKKQHLKLLEDNLAKEMAQWEKMWSFARREMNIFNIHSKDAFGGELQDQMSKHIAHDMSMVEKVIGEKVTEDDLMLLAQHNPNIFFSILKKVFGLMLYVARLPISWDDLQPSNIEQLINRIVEGDRAQNGGEVTPWISTAEKLVKIALKLKNQFSDGKSWSEIIDSNIPSVQGLQQLQQLQMLGVYGQQAQQQMPTLMLANLQQLPVMVIPISQANNILI